jgi:hypothetical protein
MPRIRHRGAWQHLLKEREKQLTASELATTPPTTEMHILCRAERKETARGRRSGGDSAAAFS